MKEGLSKGPEGKKWLFHFHLPHNGSGNSRIDRFAKQVTANNEVYKDENGNGGKFSGFSGEQIHTDEDDIPTFAVDFKFTDE